MDFQPFTSGINIEGYWVTDTSGELKQKLDLWECDGTTVQWVEITGRQLTHMNLKFKMEVKTRTQELDVSVFP